MAHGPHSGTIGSVASTANLVNCILGAGLVALPYTFMECGWLLATLLMVVSALACRFSYCLLLYCRQISYRKTYEDMAHEALGELGRQLIRWCEAALNLGTTVAYINILADVLSAVAGTLIPPGAEPSRNQYIMGVTVLAALPVAVIVRDPHTVSALSTASVAFLFVFALAMVVLAATGPAAVDTGVPAAELLRWRWDGLLVSFPVMAYGYTAHTDYLGIYTDMRRPTITRMLRVTDSALSIASSLYLGVGVAGYVQWRARTSGDLLRNLGAPGLGGVRGAYERALKACYGLSILGCIPMMIPPFYVLLLNPPEQTQAQKEGATSLDIGPTKPQHAGHTSEGATPEEQASLLADDSTGINYSNGHLALHPAPSLEAAPGSAAALQRVLNRRNKSARTTVQHAASGALLSAVGGAATDYKPSTVAPAAEADGSLGLGMVAGNSRRGRDSGDGGVSGSTVHASHPQPTITAGGIQSASPSHTATTGPAACTQADSRPGSTSGSSSASDGEGVGIRADGKGGKKAGSAKQAPRSALSALSGIARYMGSTTMRHGARHPRAQKDTEALSAYYLFLLVQPDFWQHAYTVVVVLGASLVCATWVPNVEFMMGLTGSTASVVLAYLMPAVVLLRLMSQAPELDIQAPASLMLPQDMRRTWAWRKRGAIALLIFGVVTGVVCTEAVLGAVKEEAAVVQLAQQLAGQEVVAAETQAAKAKAQEAAATVAAVEAAAAKLGAAQASANSTLDRLQHAAATLNKVTNSSGASGASQSGKAASGGGGIAGGIAGWVEERKQQAADTKALKGVELQLKVIRDQVALSQQEVLDVLSQLDTALTQIRTDAEAAAAARANATAAAVASGTGASKRERTSQLAAELSKAMMVFDKKWGGSSTGSSTAAAATALEVGGGAGGTGEGARLAVVRGHVADTLAALNQSAAVLDEVAVAVAVARRANKNDAEVRSDAAAAMAAALNATAMSQLALSVTQQALSSSAAAEADELVAALTKVTAEMARARARTSTVVIPVASGGSSSSATAGSSGAGSSTGGAADGAATGKTSSVLGQVPRGRVGDGEVGGSEGSSLSDVSPAPRPEPTGFSTTAPAGDVGGGSASSTGTSALSSEKLKQIQDAVQKLDAVTGGLSGGGPATGGVGAATAADTGAGPTAAASETASKPDIITAGSESHTPSSKPSSETLPSPRPKPEASSEPDTRPPLASQTEAAAVLAGAVEAAEGAHASVVEQITHTLNSSDAKVTEKVVGISEDLIEAGEVASSTEQAAGATAVTRSDSGVPQHEADPAVQGPVVKVGESGQLVQLDPLPPLATGTSGSVGTGDGGQHAQQGTGASGQIQQRTHDMESKSPKGRRLEGGMPAPATTGRKAATVTERRRAAGSVLGSFSVAENHARVLSDQQHHHQLGRKDLAVTHHSKDGGQPQRDQQEGQQLARKLIT